ncbi:hypothetical protein LCGC14_1618140 [marine sediment metagenome]|uniref:Uncharacterized protein n=1 Tax=marine sediment metagenome TaxID=412755 RepID=A0A0F9I6K7_9ZZZZ
MFEITGSFIICIVVSFIAGGLIVAGSSSTPSREDCLTPLLEQKIGSHSI